MSHIALQHLLPAIAKTVPFLRSFMGSRRYAALHHKPGSGERAS
jgi:hypothetical protein